jgi:hypothetical protein
VLSLILNKTSWAAGLRSITQTPLQRVDAVSPLKQKPMQAHHQKIVKNKERGYPLFFFEEALIISIIKAFFNGYFLMP